MIEKDIGKRIREYRKLRVITQEALAEKLGITTHYMSSLERGLYNIKLELLVTILNELECPADDIFCDVINAHLGLEPLSSRGKLRSYRLMSSIKFMR